MSEQLVGFIIGGIIGVLLTILVWCIFDSFFNHPEDN